MSVVGDNIRALRHMHGITQQELAEIAGVTRETVNKWEAGSISNLRTFNIEHLREHFNLSIDDLRSESFGLAARLMCGSIDGARVPRLALSGESLKELVDVPVSILEKHPHAFAVCVDDDSMTRVLPLGCDAIVDPDIDLSPGAIVLMDHPNGGPSPVFRRVHLGETKALLSIESYERYEEDFVSELGAIHITGTVVWFQPSAELG